jgi:4-hydroxy-tetrahydrodipicolinate synthase
MFEKNVNAQLDAGIEGLILGGSLGEGSTLDGEEKIQLMEYAVEMVKGKIPVVLTIAEQATKVAIQLAQDAEKNGADGLMILPPMRYKADDRETVQYFKTIAANTSLPVMIYNNPVDYKIEVTPDMFEELTVCPNIQYVKESTRDVTNITRMRNRFGNRYKLFCGVDTLVMEELMRRRYCGRTGGRLSQRNGSYLQIGKSRYVQRGVRDLQMVFAFIRIGYSSQTGTIY